LGVVGDDINEAPLMFVKGPVDSFGKEDSI
jgi:hypothetical protein